MPPPAETINQYVVGSLLGKGGMGEVYLARDTRLDRNVAIKFLSEKRHKDRGSRERFLAEAKAAAALDHPFICKIYEAGEVDGHSYIVMEYVEGKTIKQHLEEGPLPLRDAVKILLEAAEALDVAHGKGIVHRDLKPSNLMCTPQGHVKVMDFGLAKNVLAEEEVELTKTMLLGDVDLTLTRTALTEHGAIVGTIPYMSPEQARGGAVDSRSDIFSLGVILVEMLTGKNPFERKSSAGTISAILNEQPPPVQSRPKVVKPALGRVLRRALAKEPGRRYKDAAEFAADIRKIQARITPLDWPPLIRRLAVASVLVAAAVVAWKLVFKPEPPLIEVKPISLLVADFENRTGDPVFDNALEQTFILGLEQAPYIDVYRRPDAREKSAQLDRERGGRLDKSMVRLVCHSEGIPVAVEGAVELTDGRYVFSARAFDPLSDESLSGEVERSVRERTDVVQTVLEAGMKLASRMGGISERTLQAFAGETFTTSSLEAMKAYSTAQMLQKAGKQIEAIAAYEEAVLEDPDFGRAYAGLAVMYRNRGDPQKGQEYQEKALSLIDKMTDREKLRTRSIWYLMTGNYPQAIEECGALVERYPADAAGVSNLALAHFFARNMEEALEIGARRVEMKRSDVNSRYNLAWYQIGTGRFEDAEKEAAGVIEANPAFTKAYVCLALSRLARADVAGATEAYRRLESVDAFGRSLASLGLADVALYEGRTAEGISLLAAGIEADLEGGRSAWAARKMAVLAEALADMGRLEEAVREADRALENSRSEAVLYPAALVYVRAGREDRVREVVSDLSRKIEPEPAVYSRIIEGEMFRRSGKAQEAVRKFQEAQRILDTWVGRTMLGRAFLDAGAFAAAHSEFELCLDRRGEAASVFLDDWPSYRLFAPLYYYLGLAQVGLKSPGADESFRNFLRIRERADPGDPLSRDARKRIAGLGGD